MANGRMSWVRTFGTTVFGFALFQAALFHFELWKVLQKAIIMNLEIKRGHLELSCWFCRGLVHLGHSTTPMPAAGKAMGQLCSKHTPAEMTKNRDWSWPPKRPEEPQSNSHGRLKMIKAHEVLTSQKYMLTVRKQCPRSRLKSAVD